MMMIQTRELEELQNRIREAERLLQSRQTGGDNTSSQPSQGQDQSAGERSF
jgi:type II secretory pathway pseudopilin PulG